MIKEKSVVYFDSLSDHSFPFASAGSPLFGLDGTAAKAELFLKELIRDDLNRLPVTAVNVDGNNVVIDCVHGSSFYGDTWIKLSGLGDIDGKPLVIVNASNSSKLVCRFPDKETMPAQSYLQGFVSVYQPKIEDVYRNGNKLHFRQFGIEMMQDYTTTTAALYMGAAKNIRETGAYIYSPTWQTQFFGKRFIFIYNETEAYFIECKSAAYIATNSWRNQPFLRIKKTGDMGEVEINHMFNDWILANPSKSIFFQIAKYPTNSANWNIEAKNTEIGLEISYPNVSVLTDFGMYRDSYGNPQFIALTNTTNDTVMYRRFNKGTLYGYYFTPRSGNSVMNPYIIYTRTY